MFNPVDVTRLTEDGLRDRELLLCPSTHRAGLVPTMNDFDGTEVDDLPPMGVGVVGTVGLFVIVGGREKRALGVGCRLPEERTSGEHLPHVSLDEVCGAGDGDRLAHVLELSGIAIPPSTELGLGVRAEDATVGESTIIINLAGTEHTPCRVSGQLDSAGINSTSTQHYVGIEEGDEWLGGRQGGGVTGAGVADVVLEGNVGGTPRFGPLSDTEVLSLGTHIHNRQRPWDGGLESSHGVTEPAQVLRGLVVADNDVNAC